MFCQGAPGQADSSPWRFSLAPLWCRLSGGYQSYEGLALLTRAALGARDREVGMFKNLTRFLRENEKLSVDKGGKATREELQVAAVALLICMAEADGNFEPDELRAIVAAINRELGLDDRQAGELVELSSFLLRDKQKRDSFIASVNSSFSPEQREILLAAAWRVLAADADVDPEELDMVTLLRKELDLNPEQAVRARMLAEQGLVAERVRALTNSGNDSH